MKDVRATKRHEEMRMAFIMAMKPFDDISAVEQLAVVSAFVGQLICMQDSRKYSPAMIMELVALNIEQGNAQALTAAAMGIVKP